MTSLSTKKTKAARELMSMLDVPPASQKSNWENNLVPYFVNRLKEWNNGQLEGELSKNQQYANLLINSKFLHEFALMHKCPFPKDMAEALEWTLLAGEECPENRRQMTNFYFIYRNLENIMKKIPCQKKSLTKK